MHKFKIKANNINSEILIKALTMSTSLKSARNFLQAKRFNATTIRN